MTGASKRTLDLVRYPRECRNQAVRKTNLRPWSHGDDNGLCGLFATVNAVRWLWPELRQKNEQDEEEVATLPRHLVQDRLRRSYNGQEAGIGAVEGLWGPQR